MKFGWVGNNSKGTRRRQVMYVVSTIALHHVTCGEILRQLTQRLSDFKSGQAGTLKSRRDEQPVASLCSLGIGIRWRHVDGSFRFGDFASCSAFIMPGGHAHCCVLLCTNRWEKRPGFSFHCFPHDDDLWKKWIVAIKHDVK